MHLAEAVEALPLQIFEGLFASAHHVGERVVLDRRFVVHGTWNRAAGRYDFIKELVDPLVDQGLLDTLSGDTDLTDEVRAVHTPGHTPGHMSVLISSQGQKVLIQCDVFIHPAQVTQEDWSPIFDGDAEASTKTRVKVLDQVEAEGTPMISCHFPAPGFGRVARKEGKRYWQVGL